MHLLDRRTLGLCSKGDNEGKSTGGVDNSSTLFGDCAGRSEASSTFSGVAAGGEEDGHEVGAAVAGLVGAGVHTGISGGGWWHWSLWSSGV